VANSRSGETPIVGDQLWIHCACVCAEHWHRGRLTAALSLAEELRTRSISNLDLAQAIADEARPRKLRATSRQNSGVRCPLIDGAPTGRSPEALEDAGLEPDGLPGTIMGIGRPCHGIYGGAN
jgi:hypothetical protein